MNYCAGAKTSSDYVLSKPDNFSKALYTLDIGENDLSLGFQNMTHPQVVATIANILSHFTQAMQVTS